jgi:hypothetical protein
MSTNPSKESSAGLHLATIAHRGLLWDAYLEFEEDPQQRTYRARMRFNRAGGDGTPKVTHTTVIIIEHSYEEAVAKARAFDDRQLEGLLRSTLPDGK